MNFNMS